MLKKFILIFCLLISIVGCNGKKDKVSIGIIVPARHHALDDIVRGFKEVIQSSDYAEQLEVIEGNAEGDINIQRAIIQKFIDKGVSVYAPIGVAPSHMVSMMLKSNSDVDIVGLATDLQEGDRFNRNPCNITAVNDDVPIADVVKFLVNYFKDMKKITVVYSDSNKIVPEVLSLEEELHKYGVILQKLMIHELKDMYNVSGVVNSDSQGIFVLKDNLVVSGIDILIEQARKRKIPLVTSDEGSVLRGAYFALGVNESDIGREGARLALALVASYFGDEDKIDACSLPIFHMKNKAMVYLNKEAIAKGYVDTEAVEQSAQKYGYKLNIVSTRVEE